MTEFSAQIALAPSLFVVKVVSQFFRRLRRFFLLTELFNP